MKNAIVLFSILLVFSAQVFAVSLPDERPDIVSATVQKDKASIVLVRTIITGKVVYPSFEMVFAGTAEGIAGTWNNPEESFTFNADGSFHNWSAPQGYDYYGTYATSGSQISVTYAGQAPITGTFSVSGNTLNLSFPSLGVNANYTKAGAAAETDVVSNAEALQIVPVEGTAATAESDDVMAGGAGTGFVVSPDGYVVTNAHVVFTGKDNEQELLNSLFGAIQASLVEEFSKYYNITQEERESVVAILSQKFIQYFARYGSFSGVTKNIYVMSGEVEPGSSLASDSWQAVVKKEGSIMDKVGEEWTWGRDIAVIKINKTGLPTVRLGDSDKVESGDKVFIIGYPDTGLDEFFEPASLMEPTVSEGIVSARRVLKNEMETIQTTAAINHGNSGGPVYNSKGEVIGLATFGVGGEAGIEAIKFCMPINLAWEYLNELNVENEKTELDSVYGEALGAFWDRDCETATAKFEEALVLYPEHPFAGDYIAECRRAVRAGEITPAQTPEDQEGQPQEDNTLLLALGAIIVAGVAAYFFFLKGKPGAAKAPAKAQAPAKKEKPAEKGGKGGRFCPGCGKKVGAGDKFCENCGAEL